MLSRHRFTTTWKAAVGVTLLLIIFTGCKHSEPSTSVSSPPPAAPEAPKVKYDQSYDKEIKEILDLARANRWEDQGEKVNRSHCALLHATVGQTGL